MMDSEPLFCIAVRAGIFGGKLVIRDIEVEHVLKMLAAGDSAETNLDECPELTPGDIRACLLFAHRTLAGERVCERVPVREAS